MSFLPTSASYLDDLNPSQREAVTHASGSLLVVAGAGSGKTRVLTYRIVHLMHKHHVAPFQICAITFTNKAANEMKERIYAMAPGTESMWVMTFHSACGRILRQEAEHIGYTPQFTIYDQSDQIRLIKRCIDDLDLDPKRFAPRAVHSRISMAKNQLIGPEEFSGRVENFFDETVAEVYLRYASQLALNNAMDFDDMLLNTVRLFDEHPEVLQRWQAKFKHILVDEYQDTNWAQYRLLQLLAGAHHNITCVGDADQSIYSWRGADVRNITRFHEDFPDAHTVVLDQNYRSTQHILDAANAVVSNNSDREDKQLWSDLGSGYPVEVIEVEDEHAEARLIASRVEWALANGHSADDVAVLYRTNAQSRVIEDVLTRQGVRYQVIGGTRFYERAEIKDAIAYLHLLVNPADSHSLMRVINTPKRGIGNTTIEKLRVWAASRSMSLWEAIDQVAMVDGLNAGTKSKIAAFAGQIRVLRDAQYELPGVAAIIERMYDVSGMVAALQAEATFEAEGRIENLGELINVAREYDQRDPNASLEHLLQSIMLHADADTIEHGGGMVTLMTLHNAKGLEYPIVVMAGMEEGLFPHSRSELEHSLEEERRLCYVGITRARERLLITHAGSRSVFGKRMFNVPSRFIDELPADSIQRTVREVTSWSPTSSYGGSTAQQYGGYGSGIARNPEKVARPFGKQPSGLSYGGASGGSTASPANGLTRRDESTIPALAVGDNVRHGQFGDGVVTRIERDELVVVRFADDGAERRLMLAYAPLERI